MKVEDLAVQLENRGLVVPDHDRAVRYLRHLGYFRLSPYTIPFQSDRVQHLFREGTVFDDVLNLYVFDRALRLLVIDALERAEVAIRAALTDHMATVYQDPCWYIDPAHFKDLRKHNELLDIVRRQVEERLSRPPEQRGSDRKYPVDRSALEHYLVTYGEPELPPSWLIAEMLTIGQLNNLIRNLKRRSDKTAIAGGIGLNEPVLTSWLQTYVRVRNICAHHGRLWNVGLGVYPMIPGSPRISWLKGENALPLQSRQRLYPVLVSLQAVLDVVSPRSSWAQRLHDLLATRPPENLRGMGVPADWAENEFWARHLS
ncbi:Abi family protein [Arthrobacter sp. Z1-15]